ncbi:MAG: MMPL family transporter [Gammaproteobacteria bacterium]|nr:MMPL family transporter [Gammaproteobacteria bacterium]
MRLNAEAVLRIVVPLVYARRRLTFALLLLATVLLGWQAAQIRTSAGFDKQIPYDHPYMKVFERYRDTFGGADLIAVALINHRGDIYNARFLQRLKQVTDAVFFVPGVDRTRVTSLFTPGVRYVAIVNGGFESGDVVPRNYHSSPQEFARIRRNVAAAHLVGRLVGDDQRGALVVAELLDHDPVTGKPLDYRRVTDQLEQIRRRFEGGGISVHIIGFAKMVGDVIDADTQVAGFFLVAVVLIGALLWLFCGALRLALLVLSAGLVAVIWEFGLMRLAGLGLDPFAILVPFLILSLGVSHGVQYINAWGHEVAVNGRDSCQASLHTFRRLAIPGTVAILTDVIGFATVALIHIRIVQELALNAALGMAAIIVTNKAMLPIVLSWVRLGDTDAFRHRQERRRRLGDACWCRLANLTSARPALALLTICTLALAWGIHEYPRLTVGDTRPGVPELRPGSTYNRDARAIARHFSIGVDLLQVIAETESYGCVDYPAMAAIDRFAWMLQNTPGVVSVQSLPHLAKVAWQAQNEGEPKWQSLPRRKAGLAASAGSIPSSLGLANADCSAMPVRTYLSDHRADTIAGVIRTIDGYVAAHPDPAVHFALASGNIGVMAATNQEIERREIVVVVWVYAVLLLTFIVSFRSWQSIVSVIGPLAWSSVLTYGFMALTGIGEKPATLPVVAFGVGIGVDDGIYLWGVLVHYLRQGRALREAYLGALRHTGKATVFTSLALIVSVATWLFSGLQFQADMGLLLLFMFTANLFGAILMLPALAWACDRIRPLKPGGGLVIE